MLMKIRAHIEHADFPKFFDVGKGHKAAAATMRNSSFN